MQKWILVEFIFKLIKRPQAMDSGKVLGHMHLRISIHHQSQWTKPSYQCTINNYTHQKSFPITAMVHKFLS